MLYIYNIILNLGSVFTAVYFGVSDKVFITLLILSAIGILGNYLVVRKLKKIAFEPVTSPEKFQELDSITRRITSLKWLCTWVTPIVCLIVIKDYI